MLRFAANLGLLFNEFAFLDRFQAAADAGFRLVEIMFPMAPIDAICAAVKKAGVELLQFNLPGGDFPAGDRGFLAMPGKRQEFRAALQQALPAAKVLGVKQFNCLAGNWAPEYSREEQLACARENLAWASPLLVEAGLTMNIEPLSPFQSPRYVFPRPSELLALLKGLGLPRIGVQYDVFHAQLVEGNLIGTLKEYLPFVGHIQVADAPERHQPGTGEINYRAVFSALEQMGYDKVVSLEYIPVGSTIESLAWLPKECRVTGTAGQLKL
jgi:hydroxypyruvate isomerase